ncbi:MAG TPA: hypothetical protein VEB40_03785 [Flavipsychrobacter sp.]|nr:hypothetical protein [Flavipsychrobacter sp.]
MSESILQITPGTIEHTFYQFTFALTDSILYDELFGIQGNFEETGVKFDQDFYQLTNGKITNAKEVTSINFREFNLVHSLVAFIGNEFVSENSDKVESFYKDVFPPGIPYEEFRSYYLSFATKFFENVQQHFGGFPDVLAALNNNEDWQVRV